MTQSEGVSAHAPHLAGLFPVTFKSVSSGLGGVSFTVSLLVYTPAHHLTGMLHVTQPVSPPLDLTSKVSGQYMPGPETIVPPPLVATLTGYPVIHWPPHGGIGPVIMPNSQMTLYIEPEWKGGHANLAFVDATGHWRHVNGVRFTLVETGNTQGASQHG